jgi:hypothetical protein
MSRIFLTGDIHGNHSFNRLSSKKWIEGKGLSGDDYLIVLGDFGIIWDGIETRQELYLKKWFNKKKFTTLFLDGNHENHNRLMQLEESGFLGGKVGIVSNSILHLKRGEIYTIGNKKILTIGGAKSSDKASRTENISWWKEEEISKEQKDNAISNLKKFDNNVDYILAHTLPDSIAQKVGFKFSHKRNNCSVSNFLDNIIESVTFKEFYCGHWHEEIDNGKYHVLYNRIIEIK